MPITRRTFLSSVAAAPAVLADKKSPPPRPNVVLIIADDIGAWMLGCYGNSEIRTPHIDLLARAGTRFARSYVATPAGSPSRATLFTGRVPRQHGIHDFLTDHPIDSPPQGQAAPPASFRDEVMVSDVLAGQGYDCAYFGKWAMGDDARPQHGFKTWYTFAGGGYADPRMSRGGDVVEEKGQLAELITARAVEFIEKQTPGRPFFAVIGHLNAHAPYTGLPQKYYDLYANTSFDSIGWQPPAPNALAGKEYLGDIIGSMRQCASVITQLDDQIPPLMKALDARKLRDDTVVIFTADNGLLFGRHGLWGSGHASNPANMFEEVVGVPMVWNWLGKVPPEAARPELVSYYDFLPTICDLTRSPLPDGRNLCGRSYLKFVLNQPLGKRETWRNLVFGQLRDTEMARDARYKLVQRNAGEGPNELYDVREDPREATNQYDNAEFVTVKERLTQDLDAWRKQYA